MKRKNQYAQHFLRNPRLVHELVGHSSIKKRDTVYDFGAGSGVITSVLAKRSGQVVAVENEPEAVALLRQNMAGYDNVVVVEGDILTVDLPEGAYKVFSNIPFHLSSPIVERLILADNPPQAIYLIVQKQFARKLVPSDSHFTSRLGVLASSVYELKIRRPLSRHDFWPRPAVDTVLIEAKLREKPLILRPHLTDYNRFLEKSFSDNSFFKTLPIGDKSTGRTIKPSELAVEEWSSLYLALSKK